MEHIAPAPEGATVSPTFIFSSICGQELTSIHYHVVVPNHQATSGVALHVHLGFLEAKLILCRQEFPKSLAIYYLQIYLPVLT